MLTQAVTRMKPTSLLANKMMEPVKPKHRDMVYEAMVKYGTDGNYEAIAADVRRMYPHMKDEQVRKRLPELLGEQRIQITGSKNTASGCQATTYKAVAELPYNLQQGKLFEA